MITDFKHVMSKRTDEELIKIITVDRDDYQLSAIDAAEEEIRVRNIDTEKLENLKVGLYNQVEKKKIFEAKKVGPLKRLANFIIDTIVYCLIIVIIFFLIDFLFAPKYPNPLLEFLVVILCFFSYYVFMETKFQRTVGKFITNTLVVTKHEDAPDSKYIIRRTLCRLIPFDALSFLFTINGFHDRFSNTTLVNNKKINLK